MIELEVGDLLEGRYRIDYPIARGGMSTVYRCVDMRLARAVAVKVMDDRYSGDPVFRHRFRREAQAMAQLSHPNLVGVYDFGSDGDVIFLVMELITGGTLRELLAERGPMPPHAATAVLQAVLTGLDVAHRANMIHRDLKPDNVLIGADHKVKLADFGLVRATSTASGTTDTIVGTTAYLSPEQVRGDELTFSSDVYSAGIVLFELLTGTTPFSGATSLEHAYARLTEDVPAPSSRIAGVPALFDELVASATASDPAERFHDAAEFLAALNDVARELQLPHFQVPVPRNAAAHRAAAVPTDSSGLPGVLAPTGVIKGAGGEAGDPGASADAEAAGYPRDDGGLFGSTPRRAENETTAFDADQLAHRAAKSSETSVMPASPRPPTGTPVPAGPSTAGAEPQPRNSERPGAQRTAGEVPSATASRADRPVSNRSPWRLAAWIVLVTLFLAAIAVGGWWLGSGRYGEIPQVIGMDRAAAVAQVEQAGFAPVTKEVYHNDVPRAFSAGTEPAFGERAVRGNQVAVLISRGRPTVPEIQPGRQAARYQDLLQDRTLTWSYGDAVFSDEAAEGDLAEVDPAPGNELPVGGKVTLRLSKGPAPVDVPNVSGMTVEQATGVLEAAGLKVGQTRERFDAAVPRGEVIDSDPAPGTQASRGSTVTLEVSNSLTIPNVEEMSIDQAKAALADAGLVVADTRRDSSATADSARMVLEISPAAGSRVDPAHPEVTLTLPGKVRVPSLIGRQAEDARDILHEAGLEASPANASGWVYRQSPSWARTVSPDSKVRLYTTGD
ncbi:serine/threonine protein kinase [Corynebacterium atypicum]|uniref:non-specific serine/threonine protein kinase n=1 Tax=Corynebacterium atypicum TaxID=191610 RepID=A0ABM5QNS4_9CORY|nr:PASTA domain-containing protein [Corynebacterium atypicum]AIG64438.1 serine/threonine protein kinase [Corynebacterium atypicum]